jgi:hypothetical protein
MVVAMGSVGFGDMPMVAMGDGNLRYDRDIRRFPLLNRWVNFLSLLPGSSLTLLVISIAFLRVYDETAFFFLGYFANARLWSNRLTVAALLVALVNLGVVELCSCEAWDRRNQDTPLRIIKLLRL